MSSAEINFSSGLPEKIDIHDSKNVHENNKSGTCSGRKVAISTLTIMPHICKNIGLGSLKGLELAGTVPSLFFTHHASRLGKNDGKFNHLCISVGKFAGFIVGAVAVVPSLLLGGVFGLARSLFKLPEVMRTSWNYGCGSALNLANDFYDINHKLIKISTNITSLSLLLSIIGAAAVISSFPVALIITTLSAPSFIGNGYSLNRYLSTLPFTRKMEV